MIHSALKDQREFIEIQFFEFKGCLRKIQTQVSNNTKGIKKKLKMGHKELAFTHHLN